MGFKEIIKQILNSEGMAEEMIRFAEKYYGDINHPYDVASKFKTLSDEWVVGLFHDILEDTEIEPYELYEFLLVRGYGHTFKYIYQLTRNKECTYFQYIDSLEGLSVIVKMADITDHLEKKSTLHESLKRRYIKAEVRLNKKLADQRTKVLHDNIWSL